MKINLNRKIHFMGIGGSALSGVAIMAKNIGFEVDGCDIEEDTAYVKKVKEAGIKVFKGHDKKHLEDDTILCISPAIVFKNNKNLEYLKAKKNGKLMLWEEFVGNYLIGKKESICIAGTHGKSTTTSLVGLIFNKANLNPSCLVGAKVLDWGGNYIIGNSKYFIIEADEFYENFLYYKPSTIILNNIEFDHPDFFKSYNEMLDSYVKFIKLLNGPKNLIINQDSIGIKNLLNKLDKAFFKKINLYGYTLNENPLIDVSNSLKGDIVEVKEKSTIFKVEDNYIGDEDKFKLCIPGDYNVSNALGVIVLCKIYNIKYSIIKEVFSSFMGVGRRMEVIGKVKGITVIDDYAHHPTAIRETLKGVKQKYPNRKITVIIEPHSYSRTKALLKLYNGVFNIADKVLIGPIFKARDRKNYNVNSQDIVDNSGHTNILYLNELDKIIDNIKKNSKEGEVIVVMGAGFSYKWSREILTNL